MGLKGSSTTSLILGDVKVPVENVLGEIGKGHSIAFNILNIGRHKISASCLGSAKNALNLAVDYVTERKQFNRPLSRFSLIKEKTANMAVKIFAAESMIYRTAGEFEKGAEFSKENEVEFSKLLKNYAEECSVNKVFASEMLDYVVDEALQMHGGYGYVSRRLNER
ncbi:acyl-CoA dehydrogenase family protein [Alteribacillus sp. JSM 102045]|uniref:acyl-CoA dehydrogenase family protein n=1 Tax=Alteribacillus sp. JSM 102045 TaxID=1562101 RepID=UPI0035BF2DB0